MAQCHFHDRIFFFFLNSKCLLLLNDHCIGTLETDFSGQWWLWGGVHNYSLTSSKSHHFFQNYLDLANYIRAISNCNDVGDKDNGYDDVACDTDDGGFADFSLSSLIMTL